MDLQPICGILTYNAVSSLRFHLLEETLCSMREAFSGPIYVLDNGSTDGSANALAQFEGIDGVTTCANIPRDGNHTPGRGRNELLKLMRSDARFDGHDILVMSDDDVLWGAEAEPLLRDIWAYAPRDLALVSGLLEPIWPWNTPRETIRCGGVPVLVRDSTPAAAWSFRAHNSNVIFPLHESTEDDGEDYEACKRLVAAGMRVGQIDVASHIGEGYSLCGNDAIRSPTSRALSSKPLDRERWGI